MANVRFDAAPETRLHDLARLTGRTKSFHIRQLVEEHVDEIEERYLAAHRLDNPATRLRSERVRRGRGLDA